MKFVSGGQSGADQAGVDAGLFLGFEVGGNMPKGWRTLDGPRPDYAQKYGMKEHHQSGYPGRTFLNVKETDGTLRFAKDFESPGELCTMRAIRQYKKEWLDVSFFNPPDFDDVLRWIEKFQIRTLNIAGNSEQTAPGIYQFTFGYLVKTFEGSPYVRIRARGSEEARQ